jgi:hypothetical protein
MEASKACDRSLIRTGGCVRYSRSAYWLLVLACAGVLGSGPVLGQPKSDDDAFVKYAELLQKEAQGPRGFLED